MRDNKIFEDLKDEVLIRFYEKAADFSDRVAAILYRSTKEVIVKNNLMASSSLYRSISTEVRKTMSEYLIRCFSNVNYAVYAHEGTKPHFPPIESIAEWVRRKKIGQSYSIKSKRLVGSNYKKLVVRQKRSETFKGYKGKKIKSKKKYSAEVRNIAYMIARKIARKGTKGIKFFDIALNQAWPEIEKEVKKIRI